jgi:hypothetical protein
MQVDIRGFEGPFAATARQFVSPEEGWWIRAKERAARPLAGSPFFNWMLVNA